MTKWLKNRERNEKIIELRKQGLHYDEIAKKLNVNQNIISTFCRENGYKLSKEEVELSRTKSNWKRSISNQNSEWSIHEKEKAENNLIKKLKDQFIYLGGYTDNDCYVEIACEKCGNTFRRTAQSVRKGFIQECPVCKLFEREDREWINEAEKLYRNTCRAIKRDECAWEREQDLIARTVTRKCVICGKEFQTTNSNKLCCSKKCSKKNTNRIATERKDKRISKDKRLDHGINAKSLFERDNGICWICGKKCDLNDFTIKDGIMIAGDLYPSVDHVVPVCNGGVHSWKNVKLAHRICNTYRYYNERETDEEETLQRLCD